MSRTLTLYPYPLPKPHSARPNAFVRSTVIIPHHGRTTQHSPPPCLPVYSTSGFDLMSIIARVATRAPSKNNPRTRRSHMFLRRGRRPPIRSAHRICPSCILAGSYNPPTGMLAKVKKGGTSLPRPFSIYTKRWSRILRNVKRVSLITGKAVRRLSISSLSSYPRGRSQYTGGGGRSRLSCRFSS